MQVTTTIKPLESVLLDSMPEILAAQDFYKGKQVLVIGGAGFVGARLCQFLLDAGADVTVMDNFSRGKNQIEGVWYIEGDCSDKYGCRESIPDQDLVFNLAAEVAGVIYNQTHHIEMFTKNLMVQMMPLKIAHEYEVERFLNVSSVCVYAPEHNSPALEENGLLGEPTKANEGYSLAKRVGEQMAMLYADAGLHTVRVRPSNIFGIGDYFDERAHVIPALIKKAHTQLVIEANGTGQERREFIYVDDVARGMMAALEHGASGEVYNLGTSGATVITIRDLLIRIQRIMGTNRPIVFSETFDAGDDSRWADAVKASCELGWDYEVGLDEGLRKTVEWYLEQQDLESGE